MADGQLPFAFDDAREPPAVPDPERQDALARDADARAYAVNPAVHVALEASAGTGKTKVLVDRYLNLLAHRRRAAARAGHHLHPQGRRRDARAHRRRSHPHGRDRARSRPTSGRTLRGRLSEIAISTIDAFCLSLLGEFPLEADVDPGFSVADETETPRLVDEALDRTLRIGRAQSAHDADIALLFARLGEVRLRQALTRLLDRRLVAVSALDRFLRAQSARPQRRTGGGARRRTGCGALRRTRRPARALSRHRARHATPFRAAAAAGLERALAPGAPPIRDWSPIWLARLRDYFLHAERRAAQAAGGT